MTDLAALASANQREVEKYFSCVAYAYPLYTVSQCGWLSPKVITDPGLRAFWHALRERVSVSMDDDQALVASQSAAMEAGVQFELASSLPALPAQAMPQSYAGEISRRAYMTNIAIKNNQLAGAIGAKDHEKVREIIDEMHAEIPQMGAQLPTALDIHERFERMVRAGNLSLPTYIIPIDTALGGMERGTLIVLAARPSMGKSALALQIARNVATSGATAIYFSLEMSAESLWARAACPLTGVQWKEVLNGTVKGEQLDLLMGKSRELASEYGDRLIIDDKRQTTETIWQTAAIKRPDLIIVDHIRLCKDKDPNEVRRMGTITSNLHDLAKALSMPILAVAQLNRGAEGNARQDEEDAKVPPPPTLTDLRGSGEIEENADVVLMMHRPDYYQPATNAPKSNTQIWERKFRNGTRNVKINLVFDVKQEWFEGK